MLVDAARPQIEDRLVGHGSSGRAVPALNVVGVDLEARLAVCFRPVREQQVLVLLIGVRLIRTRLDVDRAAKDSA